MVEINTDYKVDAKALSLKNFLGLSDDRAEAIAKIYDAKFEKLKGKELIITNKNIAKKINEILSSYFERLDESIREYLELEAGQALNVNEIIYLAYFLGFADGQNFKEIELQIQSVKDHAKKREQINNDMSYM